MRECWNWQTGMTKDHVNVFSCGFKSHFPHFRLKQRDGKMAEISCKIKGFGHFSFYLPEGDEGKAKRNAAGLLTCCIVHENKIFLKISDE